MPATDLRKDNRQFAALSGFGIAIVVLGHSQGTTAVRAAQLIASDTAYRAWSLIIDWIYSFHMPLIMAISGFLYYQVTARKSGHSYGALLLGKAKRLLAPYVIISTIAFLPKMRLASFAMRPTGVSLSDYARSLFIP